jgi:heterodisulfide reductase subunit C
MDRSLCSHGSPLEQRCTQCTEAALRAVEVRAIVTALRPLAVRKNSRQHSVMVPLDLVQRLVAWMDTV